MRLRVKRDNVRQHKRTFNRISGTRMINLDVNPSRLAPTEFLLPLLGSQALNCTNPIHWHWHPGPLNISSHHMSALKGSSSKLCTSGTPSITSHHIQTPGIPDREAMHIVTRPHTWSRLLRLCNQGPLTSELTC